MKLGKKKIIAIILIIIISLTLFPILSSFFITPTISDINILSITGGQDILVIVATAKISHSSFLTLTIEDSDLIIKYEEKDFGKIKIAQKLEILPYSSSELSIFLTVTEKEKETFSKVLQEILSNGKVDIKYSGSIYVKNLFFGTWIGVSGSAKIYYNPFLSLIESISVFRDNLIVRINNTLNSDFAIRNVNGSIYINNIRSFLISSNNEFIFTIGKRGTMNFNVKSLENIEEKLQQALSRDFKARVDMNFEIRFGNFSIPVRLILEEEIKIPSELKFKLIEAKFFKYPDRFEIIGDLEGFKAGNIKIEGLPLNAGEGNVFIKDINVGDFRIIEPVLVNNEVYNRFLFLPSRDNFYEIVKNLLNNTSLSLLLDNINNLRIRFFNTEVNLNIKRFNINLDWYKTGFNINIIPYSLSYDSNNKNLEIGFRFIFTTVNITGLPVIIKKLIAEINFENKIKFNQSIIIPIDLTNQTYFISKVRLNTLDPAVKSLIERFSQEGYITTTIERMWITMQSYNKEFSYTSNVKINLRISPLDIINLITKMEKISQLDDKFKLDLELQMSSKLVIDNLFVKDTILTILTIEGEKLLENYKQELNKVLKGNETINLNTTAIVKISNELLSKIIKDFFEKGQTELIILNAEILISIGEFDVKLRIQNVTLNVIFLPTINVSIEKLKVVQPGNKVNISYTLTLHGVEVPVEIIELNGIVRDLDFNNLGSLNFKNLKLEGGILRGEGEINFLGKNYKSISNIFFGYNSTVYISNLTTKLVIAGNLYEIKTEKTLFLRLIPKIEIFNINVTVKDILIKEPGNVADILIAIKLLKGEIKEDVEPYNSTFIIYDEIGLEIGKGIANNFKKISQTEYEGLAKVELRNGTRLNKIAETLAKGNIATFYARNITIVVKIGEYYYEGIIPRELEVKYKGLPIILNLIKFRVTQLSSSYAYAYVDINITNPYSFPIYIDIAEFKVYDKYDDKQFGYGEISDITIEGKSSKILTNISVTIPTYWVNIVTRHYNGQTETLDMLVYAELRASILIFSLKLFLEYKTDIIKVVYP